MKLFFKATATRYGLACAICFFSAASAMAGGWDTGLPASLPEVARVESAKALVGRMIADAKSGRLAESSTSTVWGPARIAEGVVGGKTTWSLLFSNVPGRECSMIVARAGRDFDAVSVGSIEMSADDLGDYARDGAFVGSCQEFGNDVKFYLRKSDFRYGGFVSCEIAGREHASRREATPNALSRDRMNAWTKL